MITKIAVFAMFPLTHVLVLGLLALVFAGLRKRRAAGWLGIAALVWLWLWSTPAAGKWLGDGIEREFPAVAVKELPAVSAVIALGGTMSGPDEGRMFPDLSGAADRVWHAARIYHARKAPLVVLSGGGCTVPGEMPESQAMRGFISDLGVPEGDILLEERSCNTRENARFTAELLRARGIKDILLVTSAMHMKRALILFRTEGLNVTPAAIDQSSRQAFGWRMLVPDAASLDGSGRAIKEWIGRLVEK